jgi:hypothetical protein
MNLWNGTLSTVSGANWNVNLGAWQAKLFRLGSGGTSATGPTNQALVVGSSTTFSTAASGTPPFSYVWKNNGAVLSGQTANAITLNPVSLSNAGTYSVQVTGGNGSATNSAVLTVLNPTNLTATLGGGKLTLNWPASHTGWRLQTQTNTAAAGLGTNWSDVIGSMQTNAWIIPINQAAPSVFFRLTYP